MRHFRLKYVRVRRGLLSHTSGYIFREAENSTIAQEYIEEYLRLNPSKVHNYILEKFLDYREGKKLPEGWDFLEVDRFTNPIEKGKL